MVIQVDRPHEMVATIKGIEQPFTYLIQHVRVQSSYRRRSDSVGWYSVLDPGIYTGVSGFSVSGPWACMHFTRPEVPVREIDMENVNMKPFALL